MAILEASTATRDILNPLELAYAGEKPRRWLLTGDVLIRMGQAGIIPPDVRLELLEGEVYELMPPGPLHASLVDLLGRLLDALLQGDAHTRRQNPIRLAAETDPQPDLA